MNVQLLWNYCRIIVESFSGVFLYFDYEFMELLVTIIDLPLYTLIQVDLPLHCMDARGCKWSQSAYIILSKSYIVGMGLWLC